MLHTMVSRIENDAVAKSSSLLDLCAFHSGEQNAGCNSKITSSDEQNEGFRSEISGGGEQDEGFSTKIFGDGEQNEG